MFDQILTAAVDLFSRLPESLFKARLRRLLYQDIVSERLIEYPLIFNHLAPRSGRILDVGCRYSHLVLQLASLGYQVTGLDLEPYPYSHSHLTFVTGDIRRTSLPSSCFAAVTAVSTIEHIGLGFYEKNQSLDPDGDRQAVVEIQRLLQPQGQFLMTVPVGRPQLTPSYRVYGSNDLKKLLTGFSSCRCFYFHKIQSSWLPCSSTAAYRAHSAPTAMAFVLADCRK